MIVVYCLDDKYKQYAELSIKTVKMFNPEAKVVVVSEKPIEVKGADKYFVFNLGGQHRNRGVGDRISNAAYLKLLLTNLPYNKVIFIDGDVLCQGSLQELWDSKVDYIGLCPSHNYGRMQAQELGIPIYGLSGVMLMRLNKLRNIDFTNKSFLIEKKIPELKTGFHHEESVLNYGWYDKLTFLDKKWNYCFDRQYDYPLNYKDVILLHFPGRNKSDMLKYYQEHFNE